MGRALVLLTCCTCAFALNPELDVSQYAHKSWSIREGFFKGRIQSIAQTPDGYLWLGTEFGLLRFDGVKTNPWEPPPGQSLPSTYIRSLLVARDGTLWIGTTKGLASWKDGRLTQYADFAGRDAGSLLEDREGSLWVSGYEAPPSRLCAIQKGVVRCYGENGEFGNGASHLYEDSSGNLWVGVVKGFWRWKPGSPEFHLMPGPNGNTFVESSDGALLVGGRNGIRRFVNGTIEPYPFPGAAWQFEARALMRDRDGGLWIGTQTQGLVHVHQGRTDLFADSDGLAGVAPRAFLEDREGSIWVVSDNGLDRFRDFAIPTVSAQQGLANTTVLAALAARDRSVWIGTSDGLKRWNRGEITAYREASTRAAQRTQRSAAPAAREIVGSGLPGRGVTSLFEDRRGRIWVATLGRLGYLEDDRFISHNAGPGGQADAFGEDNAGNLWLAVQEHGLVRLSPQDEIQQIPWPSLRSKSDAISLAVDSTQGGLWLGFYPEGLGYFKDGQVRASYSAANGLGAGMIQDLRLDRDGTLWASTEGGLSRLKDGHARTLTSKHGLPCDTVHWSIEDDDGWLWLYMACGMVRVARSELDAWTANPNHTIQTTLFDSSDGVRTAALSGYYKPQVSKSPDGKLWFAQGDSVGVIDPRHLPINKLPPPVQIEKIVADRKTYPTDAALKLPPLTRDLEIDYTALSLVDPEKNRFRYKLEGYDRDWQDVGTRRQAFYTNVGPRNYHFRVMASNNSGVWNEAGDSLDFSIAPAYYQTTWFRASCVAAFFALLWSLYRYRLYQIKRELNSRLEGRVGERMRIAGELHDTLLQSFQGSLLVMGAARNLLSRQPEQAAQTLDRAMSMAAGAIAEGRDAVQDIRSSATTENDLAKAVEAVGQELAAYHRDATGDAAAFSLEVEGAAQDLHPILRDEIYRIATEALRNAFQHARARGIEVEIRYDPRHLRVRLRDDGIGIGADVLSKEGREGHFGFRGMRERAKGIGGRLEIWSEQEAGTEVELIVPASVAYARQTGRRSMLFRSRLFRSRLFRSKVGTNS